MNSLFPLILFLWLLPVTQIAAQSRVGRAPELRKLDPSTISFAFEARIPDLERPFIDPAPEDRNDGLAVGQLGIDGGKRNPLLDLANRIAEGAYGNIDSLLLHFRGKLVFESYFRRGRVNYPHYQMSITKSYTAMAIGRAIQLGYLTMGDLNRPVLFFLEDVDRSRLVAGAGRITLAEVLNMRSGIRLSPQAANSIQRTWDNLRGQRQVQAYLQFSEPIPNSPREFRYQSTDPSIAMQVLEVVVPGSARDFISSEVLGQLGISSFGWQSDLSGLPKAAAGSSLRSRDMVKWGLVLLAEGRWKGEQLIPVRFIRRAISRLHTNQQQHSYGYFWWRHNVESGDRKFDCLSGRGAGGQFILVFPGLELVAVITAHEKGLGPILKTLPRRILPAFHD